MGKIFLSLSFIMGVVVLASNYLVQFPINHYGLGEILTYGAFSYPIAFLITDLANRSYGKRVARKIVYIGFTIGICFTKLFVKLLPKSGRIRKTAITAKISTRINVAYSFNFGFQTKAANIPPHALIRKCVLSPVKIETMIDKKPIIPENKPALFCLLTAIAIKTQNTGNETLAIYPPGTLSLIHI